MNSSVYHLKIIFDFLQRFGYKGIGKQRDETEHAQTAQVVDANSHTSYQNTTGVEIFVDG